MLKNILEFDTVIYSIILTSVLGEYSIMLQVKNFHVLNEKGRNQTQAFNTGTVGNRLSIF